MYSPPGRGQDQVETWPPFEPGMGTTAQGVPALEDPPWEVGPRAGGGPARTTRRAVGPTWITIPRGGSGARCGDPGGVIASQGTVSRPCALRDGMDAWAPRATQVVTR